MAREDDSGQLREALRAARTDQGLTLRQVARVAGIAPSSLARIESGQTNPSVATVRRVAEALDARGLTASALQGAAGDLVARALGAPGPGLLDSDTDRLLSAFDRLDPEHRRLVLGVAEGLADRLEPVSELPVPPVADEDIVVPSKPADHYVHGWTASTALYELGLGGPLAHLAGAQFSKPFEPLARGDLVWVVYVDEDGRVHLIGRLEVASGRDYPGLLRKPDRVIFSRRAAQKALRRASGDLYPAAEHLLAIPNTRVQLKNLVMPADLCRQLRFRTAAGETAVAIGDNGRVPAQAFRSLRLLTPNSARQVERLWSDVPTPSSQMRSWKPVVPQ